MHFVYILECADKSLYVGSTNNLEKRLRAHNHLKSGAHYTKIRRPVVLKYSEKLKTFNAARKREADIKRWSRIEKLVFINMKKSLDKKHIVYHKDGSVWAKGKMVAGGCDGYWEWFRKDGVKMRSGYFKKGKQTGEWTTYDKKGKIYKVTNMK